MMTVAQFAEAVHQYERHFGASETSGFRTPVHNRFEGGQPDSAHLFGLARDVVYDGAVPPLNDVQSFAAPLGLMVIRESDRPHDHIQPTGWKTWVAEHADLIPRVT